MDAASDHNPMMRWRLALIVTAALSLAVPPAGAVVERGYSRVLFPIAQRLLTRVSNLAPFALFDLLLVAVIGGVIAFTWRDVRQQRRRGWLALSARAALRLAVVASAAYLLFLACWGLNYRREPLMARTAYDPALITLEHATRLGAYAVKRANALHGAAHGVTPPPLHQVDAHLARAFAAAQPAFAAPTPIVVARPKATVLDLYFRRAGVAGMTDPYFLETLIASDLLPVERPMVIAHEWAHLAGLGDEGEASFAGFLACLRGSALHQYSAWLSLYTDVVNGLPDEAAEQLARTLDPGPRADLQAIRERLLRQISPVVSAAGWRVYDQYLKANRVDAGTASYSEIVRLVLGTRAVDY
jgi:hypothetical protein